MFFLLPLEQCACLKMDDVPQTVPVRIVLSLSVTVVAGVDRKVVDPRRDLLLVDRVVCLNLTKANLDQVALVAIRDKTLMVI